MRRFATASLIVGILLSSVAHSAVQEPGETAAAHAIHTNRFSIGVAGGMFRFNSGYGLMLANRLPIYISGEDTLGLDQTNLTLIVYGDWKITPKHALGFHYFGVDREGSKLQVNEQFGPLFVNGSLQAQDRTSFYYLNYSYAFINEEDRFFRGSVGIYALDMEFSLQAFGDVRLDDEPIASGSVVDELSLFAPLPMIGVQYANSWSERWLTTTRIIFIAGTVNDIRAVIVDLNVTARYSLSRNVGLIFGMNYFDADVDFSKDNEDQDISYGYDGLFLGLDFQF